MTSAAASNGSQARAYQSQVRLGLGPLRAKGLLLRFVGQGCRSLPAIVTILSWQRLFAAPKKLAMVRAELGRASRTSSEADAGGLGKSPKIGIAVPDVELAVRIHHERFRIGGWQIMDVGSETSKMFIFVADRWAASPRLQ